MAQPGLGNNDDVCTQAFIDAMRAPILADLAAAQAAGDAEKAAGLQRAADNLDKAEVRKNIQPFGAAVFQIATARALVTSAADVDPAFWQWVAEVAAWLVALSTWQKGVAQAFNGWAAATPAEQALKNAMQAVPALGTPPASAPTHLSALIK